MLKVIETIPSAEGVRPMLAGAAGNVREERVAAVGGWDRFDAEEMRVRKNQKHNLFVCTFMIDAC